MIYTDRRPEPPEKARKKMRKFYLIESRSGDQFETPLKAKDKQDALEIAKVMWEKLSKDDQKRTEYIYVAECEEITPPEDWDGASDIEECPNIIDGETVYKIIDTRIIKSAFIDAYQILPDSEKRRFPCPESHSVDIK